MRIFREPVIYKPNEIFYLTPLSDAHVDAASCDKVALQSLIAERKKLKNHYFIFVGDVGNLVVSTDTKRFTPSVPVNQLASSDNYTKDAADYICKTLGDIKVAGFCMGNHESAYLAHNNTCFTDILAYRYNTRNLGYSGRFVFDMRKSNNHSKTQLNILYHHGAWAGKTKVPHGFKDWTRPHEDWDIAMCGHNHHLATETEARVSTPRSGNRTYKRKVHYVVCGTYQDEDCDTECRAMPGYAERKGYPAAIVGTPLISWSIKETSQTQAKRTGQAQRYKDIRVTI